MKIKPKTRDQWKINATQRKWRPAQEPQPTPNELDFLVPVLSIIGLALFLVVIVPGCARADEIPESRAINAVLGEAEGEGFTGMLAVSCAIRNRGTLRGVYGERAPRVLAKAYSDVIYDQAEAAWRFSRDAQRCEDLIHGADHWEGTSFKAPAWARGMIVTAVIGNQRFYKIKPKKGTK